MHEERDEPNLTSQFAGIIAMMSAMVKTLPPSTRRRLVHQTHAEFESLLAAMSTSGASQVQAEREGVEWMRDLFLKRIAQADSKQKTRKADTGAAESATRSTRDTRSQADEHLSSPDVDLEL